MRQEAGDKLRVTIISPGFIHTNLADSMTNPEVKAQTVGAMDKMAMPPDAIARAIALAIGQPPDVDVNEIVIRGARHKSGADSAASWRGLQAAASRFVSMPVWNVSEIPNF